MMLTMTKQCLIEALGRLLKLYHARGKQYEAGGRSEGVRRRAPCAWFGKRPPSAGLLMKNLLLHPTQFIGLLSKGFLCSARQEPRSPSH